ncbi:group II intron reverse transcriptase/maturase [Nostoc sp. CENA67]|uniref:Group II intron reverse transcriptase/maturase n=1 Tax=Amazonocrinis nigriterrae CENA67 TaxID=2794033 RepID=A0A8J7LBK9_9NOST|nr:group II intron reverse transcriptase/maturase [Amazonocrinis nigriterrae]MBH8563781.1 group II intron reverse transcriptase/maturase [Amazonocrinis nigriterrae CENA67]
MSELTTTYEWKTIPWRKLERKVFKLQTRIYRASQRGDVQTVRRLQKLLVKSWYAKCLAVRRVTQDNQGKKTPGIDGLKSLTPVARLILVHSLKVGSKVAPTRRIWIPKPGTTEKRPLGIPTIYDRALQALVKLVLEPEWEAKFEADSYGFRPGRSVHDAIAAIFSHISRVPKYVLDADIAKCFDRINHVTLLRKINTYPQLRKQIKSWLKAGFMDGGRLFPTEEGTPQGGVLSPLLANIALHGMEAAIQKAFPRRSPRISGKTTKIPAPALVRYADDFVIFHTDLEVIKGCQKVLDDWLKDLGLELKPSKTKITHTLENHQGNVGFDFLEFNIRLYAMGKTHSVKDTHGRILDFKPLIKPSKEAVKKHLQKIGKIIDSHKAAPQKALIAKLNPAIMGWARYYSTQASKETFTKVDHLIFQQLLAWAKGRHPRKGVKWIAEKYWTVQDSVKWDFKTKDGKFLLWKHAKIPIKRHTKVQDDRSPYDGDWAYWGSRLGKHPELTTTKAKLLKQQKGKCIHCSLTFKDGDLMEIDHITPKFKGGNNKLENLQILHRHCHDEKTADDYANVFYPVTEEDYLYENPF